MSWFQKISQSMAPTYTGVGHGYRWDASEHKYKELWQSSDSDPVLLWLYEDGQIIEEKRERSNQPHWSDSDDARGRIETGSGRGSVIFNNRGKFDTSLQKKILNALIDKYPGIQFCIYERGGPYSLQEYWDKLNSDRVIGFSVNWLQKTAQMWWNMTRDDFMKHHNTGYIRPYENYTIERVNEFVPPKENYPILLNTMNINGYEIEFRQSGKRSKYVKHEDGGEEIARDKNGLALYLSDEEQQAGGYPLEETTIHIFVEEQCIGWVGPSFGATELFVVEEFQHMGIGSAALKMWLQKYPSLANKPRRLGQMTSMGENTARKVHKQIVEEALQQNKQVPDNVLRDYPDFFGGGDEN